MNGITERLANLDWKTVVVIVVVLVGLRYALIKQGSAAAKSIAEIAESLAIAMGLVFLVIRPLFIQSFFIPSESMVPTLLVSDHILVNKTVYRIRDPKYKDIVVFDAPREALEISPQAEAKQADYIKRCIGVPGDVVYVTAGYISGQQGITPLTWNHADLRVSYPNSRVRIKGDGLYVNGQKVNDQELVEKLGATGKLEYHPGQVFINGKPLDEPYIAEDPDFSYPNLQPDPRDVQGDDMVKNLLKAEQRGKLKIIRDGGPLRVKLMPGEYLMMGDNRNNSSDGRYWGPLDRDRVLGRAMFIFYPLGRVRWVR